MSGHKSAGRSACQNCDAPLAGPYCSQCGQHDIDYHRSFGPVVEDALEGFFHFDGRFLKTVRFLFIRPGFLTAEFIAGRRTSFTNPLRFYIFASFLFFASGLLPGAQQHANPVVVESAKREAVSGGAKPGKDEAEFNDFMARHFGARGPIDRKAIAREIGHLLPTMLFVCVPFLALALKFAFRRSGKVYIEHLVFALHTQALVFLCSLVSRVLETAVLLVWKPLYGVVGVTIFLVGSWLIYRSLRAVYGGGRAKTLFKAALIGCAYGAVLLVGIAAVSLFSVYLVAREG